MQKKHVRKTDVPLTSCKRSTQKKATIPHQYQQCQPSSREKSTCKQQTSMALFDLTFWNHFGTIGTNNSLQLRIEAVQHLQEDLFEA